MSLFAALLSRTADYPDYIMPKLGIFISLISYAQPSLGNNDYLAL